MLVNKFVYRDSGVNPNAGFARFSCELTGAQKAHVRVWVTGRNDG